MTQDDLGRTEDAPRGAPEKLYKLADFGVSCPLEHQATAGANVIKGTLEYLAPEVQEGMQASAKSDAFALAITLWELANQERFW